MSYVNEKVQVPCPPGCASNGKLFNRITIIILGIVALFVAILCIMIIVSFNSLGGNDGNRQLINATRVLAIIGLIVALVVLIFVIYGILAPDGTFKEYIKPYAQGNFSGVTTLQRR